MPHPLIGDARPEGVALATMRERGGAWAGYQNVDLGHRQLGHLKFLKVGADCTFKEPPDRLPDTPREINWRYYFVGMIDLETGKIVPNAWKEEAPCAD